MDEITVENLKRHTEAAAYIWHPTKPIALARSSKALADEVDRLVALGARPGAMFKFRLPPHGSPDWERVDFLTFSIEVFKHGQQSGATYAARFDQSHSVGSWNVAHPELALKPYDPWETDND